MTPRLMVMSCVLACASPSPPAAPVGSASSAPAPPVASPPDASPPPPTPVDVTLVIAPVCEPAGFTVTLSMPADRRPVFRLDDEVMGTSGVAALISDATAKDARGPLPLVRRLRDRVLEFTPSRDASGTITFQYRARSVSTTETGALEGLRHDATGIGGHGRHFLVLPDTRRRYSIRVSWDAPQCAGTVTGEGMSTFGRAAPSETAGELSSLREAVYYWGHPRQEAIDNLRFAWFGEPAFDVGPASTWAARMFAAERAFFADDDQAPFSVFVRVLQSHEDRANGIGQPTSYLSWIGPRTTFARRLKINIAHEMLHHWLGMRLRLRGVEGTAYWFTEGFTVHFSNVIAFRAGLLSVDEFLETLNDIATRHFDNKHAGASNDEIRRAFYRDPTFSIVPYTRGALYAAELDAAMRSASHGKRRLDDVVRELYQESRAPNNADGLPADTVRKVVQAELGRVDRYDAVIVRGGHPNPPADAYGPCFTRKPRKPTGFEWARVPGVAEDQCRTW